MPLVGLVAEKKKNNRHSVDTLPGLSSLLRSKPAARIKECSQFHKTYII
jgi:hypothetical protein